MKELGYDLSTHTSKSVDLFNGHEIDAAVTMGCGDACPFVPGKRYLDWNLEDPAGRLPAEVRAIREEIGGRVDALLREL